MTDIDKLRYPIGPMERPKTPLDAAARAGYLQTIELAPARIRALVSGLSDRQLDTPYRPGGWTIRQVVHHVPDSHLNAYIRMKVAVTEKEPSIKTYEESRWAELPEAKSGPIAMSIDLLDALHRRWIAFLRALAEPEYARRISIPSWAVSRLMKRLRCTRGIAATTQHTSSRRFLKSRPSPNTVLSSPSTFGWKFLAFVEPRGRGWWRVPQQPRPWRPRNEDCMN